MKSSWDNLTVEPLRGFDWNFSWWQSFGEGCELSVYCYEENGEIVGIAPFFVDRWLGQQRLRFLGSGSTCSDYAQVISLPMHRDNFVAHIATDINDSATISVVELEGVCGVSEDEQICHSLGNSFWRYDGQLEPTWILRTPETWEQFIGQAKKSLRRKVIKAVKRLDSGEVQVRSTREKLDVELALDILVELHQERFEGKGEPGVFGNPQFTNFLRSAINKLCEKDRAEILVGYANGKPIVVQLYLLGASGPQLYQSGVRTDAMKLEPGHLLFAHAVRKSIENGYRVFDFLRGSEPYKAYWGAVPQQLLEIRCVSKHIWPTAINKTYCFLRNVKQGYSRLLAKTSPSQSSGRTLQ